MEMLLYTLRRIGISIMTLLLVAAITFFLMNAIPGSPFMTEKSTPEQIALAIRIDRLERCSLCSTESQE